MDWAPSRGTSPGARSAGKQHSLIPILILPFQPFLRTTLSLGNPTLLGGCCLPDFPRQKKKVEIGSSSSLLSLLVRFPCHQ